MNDFITEILKTLANKGDLNELFRVHLEKAVNTLLKTELTAFLDYEKYDRIGFNTGNSRNGSYDRTVKTSMGNFIPRFRATAMVSSSNRLFLLIDGRMTR
ncbi:MAG: transposase [Streptococcus salivarius]